MHLTLWCFRNINMQVIFRIVVNIFFLRFFDQVLSAKKNVDAIKRPDNKEG